MSYSIIVAEPNNVLIALILTCVVTVSLTIYAFFTKTDFTICGGLLFIMAFLIIGVAILFKIFGAGRLQYILLCALVLVFYGIYLIYDT